MSKRVICAYCFVKKRRPVFAVFKIILLRNRSFSNARKFCPGKRKICKGNLYLTKNQIGWKQNLLWVGYSQLYE